MVERGRLRFTLSLAGVVAWSSCTVLARISNCITAVMVAFLPKLMANCDRGVIFLIKLGY